MGRDGHSPGLTLAAVGELDSEPGVQAADGTSWVREGQVRGLGPEPLEPEGLFTALRGL